MEKGLIEKLDKQHNEIIRQKKALDDSIRYASKIQKAIIPTKEQFCKILADSFVLFQPKEIVSGDFYWIKTVDKKIVVVAADCTGHGVPGAFISLLGISFLNEIISRNNSVLRANRILNDLREYIMKTLNQTGNDEEQRDGMDISLCIIDPVIDELQFSGANNSLYLFRDGNIIELKADRMPIGVDAYVEESFTNHNMKLKKNDTIYIFTDGFADQFGGEEGKKYKYPQFRNLLSKIQVIPIHNQEVVLWDEFQKWKSKYEQIDDVLVIGIRY
jgi:serine phosphatase RsbU (regulator of sigma subunit)